MSLLKRAAARVRAFFRKPALDAELEAELAAHIELAIEDNLARGLSAAEARRLALVSLGGMERAKDQHREARGLMQLDILLQDLKYTFRTLGRDRGFTVVAILILALGIGSNVAVFSVVNTLMLRPLPFDQAQQLVWIAPPPTKCGLSCATYSTDAYDEFRMYSRSYQDVTGYFAFSSADNLSLNLGGAPIPATSIDVIANFFQVLGVQPAKGRLFRPEDGRNGAAPVVLLTDAWWRRQFNADPNIVGKAFDMNGQQTTVIGVLPKTFDFGAVFSPGAKVDAITPLNLYGPPRDWGNIITFIGRLKPGVSLAQAVQDAAAAAPHMCWNNKYPDTCGELQRLRGPSAAERLRERAVAARAGCAVVRRGHDLADCVRKPVKPVAGPRRRAQQGVCDARRSRREPRPDRGPVADGEPGSLVRGRVVRAWSCRHSCFVAGAPRRHRAAPAEHLAH